MNYSKKVLPNGLRIVTIPVADAASTTFMVMSDTGSKFEKKEERGLAHFLEHMVFKGTKNRPTSFAITKELDGIGAHYNAFTSHEYTGYYAKVAPEFLDTAISVVSDIYLNPLFDAKEIEKEKGVIIEEMRMYRDLPQQNIQYLFLELLYGDTPVGRHLIGTESTINSFNRDNFVNYFAQKYTPAHAIVVISGKFDNAAVEKVEKIFGDVPTKERSTKEPVVEAQIVPALKILEKDTDQTHLVLGFRSFGATHDNTAIRMLSGILSAGMSSRLFMKLREEMGVGYYVHAANDVYTDHGVFAISAGVDSKRLNEVISVLLEECRKLKTDLVDGEELERTKNNIIGSTSLSLESSDAQAEFVVIQEILKGKIDTFADMEKKIRAITAEDIRKVAQEIFTEKNLNLAIVGKGYQSDTILPLLKV